MVTMVQITPILITMSTFMKNMMAPDIPSTEVKVGIATITMTPNISMTIIILQATMTTKIRIRPVRTTVMLRQTKLVKIVPICPLTTKTTIMTRRVMMITTMFICQMMMFMKIRTRAMSQV